MKFVAKATTVLVSGFFGALGWIVIFPIAALTINSLLRTIWQWGWIDFTWIGKAING